MNKKSIGKFLKENNAIFSYIKDDNGYRIGMIIGVKSNDSIINEPRIGVAFFNEPSILNNKNKKICIIQNRWFVKKCNTNSRFINI